MSDSLAAEIRSGLGSRPGLKLIIAIGNTLRADDGVGPYIAAGLESSRSLKIVNAGSNPENVVEEIIAMRPRQILIIDAADFRSRPGEARLIDQKHIPETALSTHAISPKVIARILSEASGATVAFLGIQPKDTGIKEGLSPEVKKTAEKIIAAVRALQNNYERT